MAVNYSVALYLLNSVLPEGPLALQSAAVLGIAAGMGFNFMLSRYVVFRKRFIRERAEE
jgi:dolichol-phosphate mannosyltransferase